MSPAVLDSSALLAWLGDRACLALARARGLPALTTDTAWTGVETGVAVHLIR